MSISIIIPVRNEEQAIGPCLDSLSGHGDLEILVVDGGSSDRTVAESLQRGYLPVRSLPGRGRQQNTGALAATGRQLLFLHCDTRLPGDFRLQVSDILGREGVAAGAFQLAINGPGIGFRIIEAGANLRSRFLHLPYGDQALFMNKETYLEAGGFPDQPILEEIAFLADVQKLGRIAVAPACAVTSARRWRQKGLIKTTLINQMVLMGWALGVSPQRLARWYYGK